MYKIIIQNINDESMLHVKTKTIKTYIEKYLKEYDITCKLVEEIEPCRLVFKKVDEDKFFSSAKQNFIKLKEDSPTRIKLGRDYLKTLRLSPEQTTKLDDCFAFLKEVYGLSFKLTIQEFADDAESLIDFRDWGINNKGVIQNLEGVA